MTVESLFPRLEPVLPGVQKPIQYVGGELNSADTLTNYEEVRRTHPPTVAHRGRPVNPADRASCHPEGPSDALLVPDRDEPGPQRSVRGVSRVAERSSHAFVTPALANLDG